MHKSLTKFQLEICYENCLSHDEDHFKELYRGIQCPNKLNHSGRPNPDFVSKVWIFIQSLGGY